MQQYQEPVELKLNHTNSQSSSTNRISEYQSKLASFKMRNNQNRSGADTGNNKQQ